MVLTNFRSLQLRIAETALTPNQIFCYREYKACLLKKSIIYEHCRQELEYCREFGEFRQAAFVPVIEDKRENERALNFTDYENLVNKRLCLKYEFADRKFCDDLCSQSGLECDSLCQSLVVNQNICPGDEKCPFGCPCPKFRCKHFTKRKQIYWQEANNINENPNLFENPFICLAYQALVGNFWDNQTTPSRIGSCQELPGRNHPTPRKFTVKPGPHPRGRVVGVIYTPSLGNQSLILLTTDQRIQKQQDLSGDWFQQLSQHK